MLCCVVLVISVFLICCCLFIDVCHSSSFWCAPDVTMTMFLTPGPVIDFLKANQNVQDPCCIDWVKVISC